MTRILITIASVLLMGLGSISQAQPRPYRPDERQVRDLLKRIEKGADRFRKSLDHALDESRLDHTEREESINRYVRDFENATDRLKDRAGHGGARSQDAEEVLQHAAVIDRFMRSRRLAPRAERDWQSLRSDLDQLARIYSISNRWSDGDDRRSRDSGPRRSHQGPEDRDRERSYRPDDQQVKDLLKRIENGADRFRKSLDDALDKSRLDHTQREDSINRYVHDFEDATDRLKDQAGHGNATSQDAEEVLKRATVIDGFMRRNELTSRAERDWRNLQSDLSQLARLYRISRR